MDFGFSYIGCIFLLMLYVPNVISIKRLSDGWRQLQEKEDRILHLLERVGEVGLTMLLPVTKNLNVKLNLWLIWLAAAFAVMVLYEIWWYRYFKSRRRAEDLLSGMFSVPVAGASLPAIALALLAIYGKSLHVMLFVIPFAVGHIKIFLQHKKELEDKESEE